MSKEPVAAAADKPAKEEEKKDKKDKQLMVPVNKALPFSLQRASVRAEVLKGILAKYGKGTIGRAVDLAHKDQPRLSSGIFQLDFALGGGWARGRCNLSWGDKSSSKTTSVLRAIANAQKIDLKTNLYIANMTEAQKKLATPLVCAFIDMEGTFDAQWAKALGVDVDSLFLARPQTAEEAGDIMQTLLNNKFDVIALDSIAAMIPGDELSGAMEDYNVGTQARLVNKMLRKIQGVLNHISKMDPMEAPTVFLINQMRKKVGVVFGCLHGSTVIPLVDGRCLKIRDIVDNKIEGEVWAFDEEAQVFSPRKIVNWFQNGKISSPEEWVSIETEAIDSTNGANKLTVTRDHKILTSKGWIQAKDLNVGDKVVTKQKNVINGTLLDFLAGILSCDSCLKTDSKNKSRIALANQAQPEYLLWKMEKLKILGKFTKVTGTDRVYYYSESSKELSDLRRVLGNRDPRAFTWTDLGFAVMFMDDGHFDDQDSHCRGSISFKRFRRDQEAMDGILGIFESMGYQPRINRSDANLCLNKDDFLRLCESICKYVPECMQYKLPIQFRGRYEPFDLKSNVEHKNVLVEVLKIGPRSKAMELARKFDLGIDGFHNYLAGNRASGICVHNSPEIKPGGVGQDFLPTIEVKFSPGKFTFYDPKEKKLPKDIEFGFQVMKNKVSPPKINGSYKMQLVDDDDLMLKASDVSELKQVMEFAEKIGIYSKDEESGKYLMYKEAFKTKGEVVAAYYLNKDRYAMLKSDILAKILAK